MRALLLLTAVALVSACATTTLPDAVRTAPAPDISVAQARQDTRAHIGQRVRWGGTIARVDNRETETDLEVVARELDGNGRPRSGDRSVGRFIARVAGFLDPAVYTEGRRVTVAGTVLEETAGRIGELKYRYPVVKADTVHLWEPLADVPDRYRYHDPFYDPFWYPWRPWPYYYPYPYYYP